MPFPSYKGFKIIKSSMTVAGPDKEVIRKFKERFFSLPLHPFQKTKMIHTLIPSRKIIIHEKKRMIIGHPETLKPLLNKLK